MPRWLLFAAALLVFALSMASGMSVMVALSAVNPQVWALGALAVAFALLLGVVPKLAPIEARFGPFLCYGSGLLLAFLYSNDLSFVSSTTAKVLALGMGWFWVVFALSALSILVPLVKRGSSVHAWLLLVCACAWLVAYFSGDAGSGGGWVEALARRLHWDASTTEAAIHWARKGVHFVFYGTVAAVGWSLARAGDAQRSTAATFGLCLALAHALFDEGRQLSATARFGSAWDVALDLAGASAFLAVAWMRSRR